MKACLVYVVEMKAEAESLANRLRTDGFEVCLELVDAVVAQALSAGEGVPTNVLECIRSADVCYFLLDGNVDLAAGIDESLRFAAGDGKRIVAIVEGQLPVAVDDLASTVLVPGSASASAAATENVPSDHPGRPGGRRHIERVKCQ